MTHDIIKHIDEIVSHTLVKPRSAFETVPKKELIQHMVDVLLQNNALTPKEDAHCFQQIINIIDNPGAGNFSRIKLVEIISNKITNKKSRRHDKRELSLAEQKTFIRHIGNHAISSDRDNLQTVCIKELGKILNDPLTRLNFKEFSEYTNIITQNLNCKKDEVKIEAFHATSALITNHENGLAYKARIQYAAEMLSIMEKQIIPTHLYATPSKRVTGLLKAIGNITKDEKLFFYGLNYAYNSSKEEKNSTTLTRNFCKNFSLLKDANYLKEKTAAMVLNRISYKDETGFTLDASSEFHLVEKPVTLKFSNFFRGDL